MSSDKGKRLPETDGGGLNFEATELTLGDNKDTNKLEQSQIDVREANKSPVSKAQVVGWPPVRVCKEREEELQIYKVAVDGAPYLRKVDIEMYDRNCLNDKKLDQVNGIEYVPTYEDKDGDWMLVGDVPWQ
ncbi:Auxin-responsive protein IAA1 [Hibiscus syriacus]|uniref:Auxin-responsive protein n=1 Tax=Hibiscus syriacus TaxID=106335 RepID=A0A6A2XKJ6_HIBSY|nr:Auxin-responsive protein IAA1 [Hibiscus syriacus]